MKIPTETLSIFSLAAVVAAVIGTAVPGTVVWAGKKQVPLATVNFVILRDENGKPIRNAAVVMHPVSDNGKQERGGIELKTDPDGKASYDGVPYGKLRIQVLAPGFQTYGDDFEIGEPSRDITIKMKRPARQYSIYEEHPAEQKDEKPK